ncbi:hypothetical protein QCA50_009917 [Cerrena zonata]|uniref:Peptidase M16 N-terminal domain-containing protein n=1 Tax=Cerrena zonata TaxID=2478898 RepID=A0AAW0G397_9APHY
MKICTLQLPTNPSLVFPVNVTPADAFDPELTPDIAIDLYISQAEVCIDLKNLHRVQDKPWCEIDANSDKSAAALDVNVGSFADKKYNVSGLAHFCEHLLFMGTEKYPEENEYSSYLSKHSGYSNAYTAAEHTNYYFESLIFKKL